MNEEEYYLSYYADMFDIMLRTREIIEQYENCDSGDICRSLLELVAVYYSVPFVGSDRAYKRKNGKNFEKYKLEKEDIGFTDEEIRVHDVIITWRNGYIAHSDQSRSNPVFELHKNERGEMIGYEGSKGFKDIPFLSYDLPILKSNIQKIIGYVLSKMYTEQGG